MGSIWTVQRSGTDTKLAGLCGGLAKQWGVDSVLIRIAFVMLALSGGMGIVLYLAGWLLLPVEGRDRAPVDNLFGGAASKWPKEAWIAIVTALSVGTLVVFGPSSIGPAIIIALVWYFGFYKPRQGNASDSTTESAGSLQNPPAGDYLPYPGPPTAFTQAAQAWQERVHEVSYQQAPVPSGSAPDWPGPPPAPRMPSAPIPTKPEPIAPQAAFLAHPDPVGFYVEAPPTAPTAVVTSADRKAARRLRLIALIMVGVTMSGLGVFDYLGATIPLAGYFGGGLLVVGLALVAATWAGRARGLLSLGVILGLATAVTATISTTPLPDPSSPTHVYTSISQLPSGVDAIDAGKLTADLSGLALSSDATYRAQVDLGQLVVIAPKDARVVVHYTTDLGMATIFGNEAAGGVDLTGEVSDPKLAEPGQRTLTLEVSVDVGSVEVTR